jgi:hypothetical protein
MTFKASALAKWTVTVLDARNNVVKTVDAPSKYAAKQQRKRFEDIYGTSTHMVQVSQAA